MVELWFIILCVMITVFVVLDGWDFGAGALHFIVARNQEERRMLITAIGPLWSWHEVWLVGTGGVLFVAFPRVLATGFPAYYLALFLVLWTFVVRGISIEFRGHIDNDLWRSFWDLPFAVSNALLAILFGLAVGNVPRGMPLAPNVPLSLALFTDFSVHGAVGIIDWYTISVAVFTLVCLSAHGTSYLATKTEGAVFRRSKNLSKWLWSSTTLLLMGISVETLMVRPELYRNLSSRPLVWAGFVIVVAAFATLFASLRSGSEAWTFRAGCLLIAGLLGTAAATLFPEILHSTVAPEDSITAFNGSSDVSSLRVAAYWWPISFVLALAYLVFISKHYAGRVQMSNDTQRPY